MGYSEEHLREILELREWISDEIEKREKVTMTAQSPHAGSGTPFFSSGSLPDFFWPVVITLAIVAFGLSIEIVLRVLKVRKEN